MEKNLTTGQAGKSVKKTSSRTGHYLKYAIGEIILVVIGILIALQINNWNENRKKQKELDAIYASIEQNLKTDLTTIEKPIEYYENLESTLTTILTTNYPASFLDSINKDNYLECTPCKSNISRFQVFQLQDNGVELLKKYENDISIEGTKFSQDIIQFYTLQGDLLSYLIDFLLNETYANLKFLEQFPWYSDYSLDIYNPEAVAYFLYDQNYKNKVANFRILIGRNYLVKLKAYKKKAIEIITKIEKRRQRM